MLNAKFMPVLKIFHKIVTSSMGLITIIISCDMLYNLIFTNARPNGREFMIFYLLFVLYFSIGLILNKRRHILYSICFYATLLPLLLELPIPIIQILCYGYIIVQLIYTYNEYKTLPIIKRTGLILTVGISFIGFAFLRGAMYSDFVFGLLVSFTFSWQFLSAVIILTGLLEEDNIFLKIDEWILKKRISR